MCNNLFFSRSILLLTLSCLLMAIPSMAENLHVPTQYNSIQEAIDAASDGDHVVIAAGTYIGLGSRGISFQGKPITVRGAGIDQTIIDCQQLDRGFDFQFGESLGSVVRDLTVVNGLDGCGT